MRRYILCGHLVTAGLLGVLGCGGLEPPAAAPRVAEAQLLEHVRQLTFEGKRAGEGYFAADGRTLVFQSEREPNNPFYQIYTMDLETGAVTRVSPGVGRTTCAWLHPDGRKVLFASTHADPEARAKQEREIQFRASGERRPYKWDYDDQYELYVRDLDGEGYTQLTQVRGYDAEASYSPDGQWIVFSSNRHAYAEQLSAEERKRLDDEPSGFNELYRMRADGTDVQRLTHEFGYDGGPFYSHDGQQIVWRRFAPDNVTAEIYTMKADGSDVRQLTKLGAMSWAPFFHPSGRYVIFSTNLHGFSNFELYMVAADLPQPVEYALPPEPPTPPVAGAPAGTAVPTPPPAPEPPPLPAGLVRVTRNDTDFDGLPVFSPDGSRLAWTLRKGQGSGGQIFMADWSHERALVDLGLAATPQPVGVPAAPPPLASIDVAELRAHVEALSGPEMEGRATGTPGEERATEYVAKRFEALGLEPAGENGYFQSFEFTAGISLGANNALAVEGARLGELQVDRDWRPLAFSSAGNAPAGDLVYAGYGILAPAGEGQPAYDSYGALNVKDKWVLAFRYLPGDLPREQRQYLARYSSLRHKAMVARNKGARGLILVTGPLAKPKDRLVPLQFDVALAGTSVFAVSVEDSVGEALVAPLGRTLEQLQTALATGSIDPGLAIPGVSVSGRVDLVQEKRQGRNVIGRLRLTQDSTAAPLMVGAHLDHLGRHPGSNSLAHGDERELVHPGADDNASGIAAILEVAQYLSQQRATLGARRDVLFAAWSGEELGLLGSDAYTGKQLPEPNPHAPPEPRKITAYLNLDMVGRLRDELYVQGIGSSTLWRSALERENAPLGLPLALQEDSYLPTDATSFYVKGVPILSLFTGAHEEYHTPRDTAEKLNYPGIARVASLVARLASDLSTRSDLPEYVATDRTRSGPMRVGIRVSLGTIPKYGQSDTKGLPLAGVARGGPAERAGIRSGDIVVGVAGKPVENIFDYTYALEELQVGEAIEVIVQRGGDRLSLTVTPESRD
jgi:Tol biopolymer transport system component